MQLHLDKLFILMQNDTQILEHMLVHKLCLSNL